MVRFRQWGDVDLDVIPAGNDRWTSVTVSTTLSTSSGGAPVTLDVSYS